MKATETPDIVLNSIRNLLRLGESLREAVEAGSDADVSKALEQRAAVLKDLSSCWNPDKSGSIEAHIADPLRKLRLQTSAIESAFEKRRQKIAADLDELQRFDQAHSAYTQQGGSRQILSKQLCG